MTKKSTEKVTPVTLLKSKVTLLEKKKPGRPKVTKDQILTRRQELFVKELVSKDGQITMREAAVNAGYPVGSAHTRAYELTNPTVSPHVVAAIRAYRQELDEKFGVTYQRHLRDLQKIRDMALDGGAYSAAVQAEYRRGQAQGDIYVSKSEIRHGSIDSMSKEDVMAALADLKDSYDPIDINPITKRKSNTKNGDKEGSRPLATYENGDIEEPEEMDADED